MGSLKQTNETLRKEAIQLPWKVESQLVKKNENFGWGVGMVLVSFSF